MIFIQLFLFFIVFASSIGVINIGPLFQIASPIGDFNAKDILLIILLVSALPSYIRQRNKLVKKTPWFRFIEFCWVCFVLFLAIESFRSPAINIPARLNNVRFVQNYLLFFPTVGLISTNKRYKWLESTGVFFAILGTVLVIVQSLNGYKPIFDSPYYDVGPWQGGIGIVGNLTRVYISVTDWIAFILFILVSSFFVKFRFRNLIIASFLLIAIFLGFSRSMWLGIIFGWAIILILFLFSGILRPSKVLIIAIIPFVIGAGLLLGPLFGFDNLTGAVSSRIVEGMLYFKTNTGTWNSRIIIQNKALDVWKQNSIWGIGTNYLSVVGSYIDLGVPATLVSVGVVGLVFITIFFLTLFILGWDTVRKGVLRRSASMVMIGASLSAEIIFAIVFQQFLAPRVYGILAIWSAVAVSHLATIPNYLKNTLKYESS